MVIYSRRQWAAREDLFAVPLRHANEHCTKLKFSDHFFQLGQWILIFQESKNRYHDMIKAHFLGAKKKLQEKLLYNFHSVPPTQILGYLQKIVASIVNTFLLYIPWWRCTLPACCKGRGESFWHCLSTTCHRSSTKRADKTSSKRKDEEKHCGWCFSKVSTKSKVAPIHLKVNVNIELISRFSLRCKHTVAVLLWLAK